MLGRIKQIRNKILADTRKKKLDRRYHQFIGKHILANEDANNLIYEKIMANEPCFITRFGSSELTCIVFYRTERSGKDSPQKWNEVHEEYLCDISGYFPFTEEAMDKFAKYYLEFIDNIDVLGVWKVGEETVTELFNKDIRLINLQAIEPYYFDQPWSRALKGKKVLVIHPFVNSIKHQYENRKLLFPGKEVLPDFDLQVIQAIQTVADNTQGFKTWFDALDTMCNEIAKADFDVAIIGAGAYGMPLANFVKTKMGKVAIHMGGATQILFGIKGQRWFDIPKVKVLFNEHWISPSADERPPGAERVEGGSYW